MEIFVKPKLKKKTGSLTTTADTYASVPDAENVANGFWFVKGFRTKLLDLHATLNALKYNVDASNNASVWHNLSSDTALASDGVTHVVNTDIWEYLRVQVKPSSSGQNGKVDAILELSSL